MSRVTTSMSPAIRANLYFTAENIDLDKLQQELVSEWYELSLKTVDNPFQLSKEVELTKRSWQNNKEIYFFKYMS